MLMITVYYALLSKTIWTMLVLALPAWGFGHLIETWAALAFMDRLCRAFVLAWIEYNLRAFGGGKKPSFLKDLQFLLIGPAWLMNFIYRRIRDKPRPDYNWQE